MKPGRKKQLLRELGWFSALLAVVSLLFGIAFVRLDASRTGVARLRGEIARKSERLRARQLSELDQEALHATEALLSDWRNSATDQSRRSAAIASAADQAGLTLLSLRDRGSITSEDERVVSFVHELVGLGSYRQVATFLDALHAAPGLVALEDLELDRDEADDSGRLRASLRVIWFAPDTPPSRAAEEGKPVKPAKSVSISVGGAVLALLALVAMPVRPALSPSSTDPAPAPQATMPVGIADPAQDPSLLAAQLVRAESLPWGPDPFFRAGAVEAVAPSLEPAPSAPRSRLTGISLKDGALLAIVDREIVRVGDALRSGYVVTRITPKTVTLQREDLEVTLTLGAEK